MEIDVQALKKLALDDFHDDVCKGLSLFDIFVFHLYRYNILVVSKKVPPELLSLLKTRKKEIIEASMITPELKKRIRYNKIFDEYFAMLNIKTNYLLIQKVFIYDRNQVDGMRTLFCPVHKIQLTKLGVKKAFDDANKKIQMPIYWCESCGRLYTSGMSSKTGQGFKVEGINYININVSEKGTDNQLKKGTQKKTTQKKTECIVYGIKQSATCGRLSCNNPMLVKHTLLKRNKNKKLNVRKCPVCGLIYVSYALYRANKEMFKCLNVNDLPNLEYEYNQLQEREQAIREKRRLHLEEQIRIAREKIEAEKRAREELEHKPKASLDNKRSGDLREHDNIIRVKDFVVRRSVFKCRHNNHTLKNIDAKINIISENGEVFERTVAAGYCKDCNTFFIMESTYQNLKKYGTPICRISDEKAYLKGGSFMNGAQLAQQSLLMQYGYTVSQEEDLSVTRRRKILSLLVDNNILTRNEIIGYLDFFINTKSAQGKYDIAVGKWEDDRDFIAHYKTGSYTKYGVGGIHRKY